MFKFGKDGNHGLIGEQIPKGSISKSDLSFRIISYYASEILTNCRIFQVLKP